MCTERDEEVAEALTHASADRCWSRQRGEGAHHSGRHRRARSTGGAQQRKQSSRVALSHRYRLEAHRAETVGDEVAALLQQVLLAAHAHVPELEAQQRVQLIKKSDAARLRHKRQHIEK